MEAPKYRKQMEAPALFSWLLHFLCEEVTWGRCSYFSRQYQNEVSDIKLEFDKVPNWTHYKKTCSW